MKIEKLISSMRNELVIMQTAMASFQKKYALLEKLLEEEPTEVETHVVSEELPKLPDVILLDDNYNFVASMSAQEEMELGCQILNEFAIDYNGKADSICLHLTTFKNKGKDKPFLDRYHVTCDVYDIEGELLASKYVHKDNLAKFTILNKLGLYSWNKEFKPKEIGFNI